MIETEVRGVDVLQRKFGQFARGIGNRTDPNRRVSINLYGWVMRNYDREGALIGGWAPLAPSTIKRKAKAGKERMLVFTGRLRNSFRSFYDNDVAGVGSDVTYSEFHEKGALHLPKRPMLPDRETALGIGIQVYDHFISTERTKAGL